MPIGWLDHRPELPSTIEGVHIERAATKTRVEEYTFVRDHVEKLAGFRAIDAATGYVDGWHMLPYILANMGWEVETFDIDERTLGMPHDENVNRQVASLSALPYDDNSCDLLCCISTLEHVAPEVRSAFNEEALRVLTPGGTLIITADNYPGITPASLASNFSNFEVDLNDYTDESRPFPGGKRVAYLTATRP